MSTSSPIKTLNIASRESALALWQSRYIKSQLEALYPGLEVNINGMTTKGDKILDVPLAKIGGKGLFVKELEASMLEGISDIAVHSMKDVPMEFPEGLELAVICERENPFDAFVSNQYDSIDQLPEGAVVGTSSLRRHSQLAASRPDLDIRPLRGNVNTRLAKLDAGEYDAIILAASGLKRLEFNERIKSVISAEQSLPAVGQGALGIECRSKDEDIKKLLAPLIHPESEFCVKAERAMNHRLHGGCQVPIAGYATLESETLTLTGLVASEDGATILKTSLSGPQAQCEELGVAVAEALLEMGAGPLLEAVYNKAQV
ncbi:MULTISPECIES: hydroxymethylbilane synthase [unclassified Oleiphilus]|uniref:hydroxymethylbilane synthase n=1 Tax=unclassified Oleiphilus TaxID=2631174 RepID=UPI0007C27828|nr:MULTISPECIES: hydroxymethylbilane synthase [unclassified Oleiphilus]KZY30660.1 hydroxymethylbilane synthase [Oleiphilus sp. HI0043]KZZ64949.1 hydroxymethylbilane synthase [Oleiphilus sp. HI0128]